MKNILITGINGFVGNHLLNELTKCGYTVSGVGREERCSQKLKNYYNINLNDSIKLNAIDFSQIDAIIHLAGLAAVGPSFNNPKLYLNTNMNIEVNLYEMCVKQDVRPLFLIISSGSLYSPTQKLPLKENSRIDPSSPYAVSKVGQEELAKYYRKRGFKCIIARPFNHIGPGQALGFITSDLAYQIFDCLKNKKNELLVGNLSAKRDYTDVRDIARGYRLLIEKGCDGEVYNLCSGTSYSGETILNKMLSNVSSKTSFNIIQDLSKYRSVDVDNIYGSYKKINKATNWKPSISLDQSIEDVMKYWKDLG